MQVNIVKSNYLEDTIFQRLENVLKPFSKPLEFIFQKGTFNEQVEKWSRNSLKETINTFRQANAIDKDEFVVFITTKRDEYNWFSACLDNWNKDIFISSIEWKEDNIINIDKIEYPIAYQIVENILCLSATFPK